MSNLYAAKLLFESTTSPKKNPEKIFEERIILVKAENEEEISDLLNNNFPPDTYSNGEGGSTTKKLINILDIFEIVDNLEESLNFKEVYSRYLLFDQDITAEKAIEKYSLDK